MYKPIDKLRHSFLDFNQPMGIHMNPDNRWIKMADQIPWDAIEEKYAGLFPRKTGMLAKTLRRTLDSLMIQNSMAILTGNVLSGLQRIHIISSL